jgi:hypothetical protein
MQDFYGKSSGPGALGSCFGGGFYIGTVTIPGPSSYYLVVSPLASGYALCQWSTTATLIGVGGCAADDETGGGFNLDGYCNTYDGMVNNTCETMRPNFSAGQWAATRTIGGFEDWYQPARRELRDCIYPNRLCLCTAERYYETFDNCTTPAQVTRFWSSNQIRQCDIGSSGATNRILTEAIFIGFCSDNSVFPGSGCEGVAQKVGSNGVRPVRRIPI